MEVYSYEDAFSASVNYFDGDNLAAKVFLDKYSLKNEKGEILEKTPEAMHRRLAKEFARIEKNKFKKPLTEQEIFNLFDKFKYIVPAGSPMYGIGNNYKVVSLSNCFLLDSPIDMYSHILDVDKQLVNISKRRGGCGIDLSNLRPKGSRVNNAANSSSGIISWMDRYSHSIREVGQDGRRGALILTLSIHHPDIVDFITAKNDTTKVIGANISVRLTREFLDAVEQNKDYELRFPVDDEKAGKDCKFSKFVSARSIWDVIVDSAFKTGEPGLLMWDNIKKYTPSDSYKEYESQGVNPCIPKYAKLLTPEGIRELKDVNIGDYIWSESGWTKVVNKWASGVKELYEYLTTFGSFVCTENHNVISNGKKSQAKNVSEVDLLRGIDESNLLINPQDVMDGLIFGDGMVHKASDNLIVLCIGENDYDYFSSEISSLITKDRRVSFKTGWEVRTTLIPEDICRTWQRKIPQRFLFDKNKICGFLRGLFSANGGLSGDRVALKASSLDVIKSAQLMLNSVGIASYYTTNHPSLVKFSNGSYLCKKSYDLNIAKMDDKQKFYRKIGFIQKYKTEKLELILKNDVCIRPDGSKGVIGVNFLGQDEVFDITVDNASHTFWCYGFNFGNCSEIILHSLDSCRLLSLNLFSFIDGPFTSTAKFNYDKFFDYAKFAQRLMDDLVDLESEKISTILNKIRSDIEPEDLKFPEIKMWETIKKNNDEGRRTGTGITGLADAMAAIGIKYGSEESIVFTDIVYRTLKLACYTSSVDMAEELGTFRGFDFEKEKDNEFIKLIGRESPELINRMKKYGRRNVALLTTAPTGSLSIETRTSSGIEPLFQLSYKRRKKITPGEKNVQVDFIDKAGDKWHEFEIIHPKLKLWIDITGENDVKKSPWFGCTAGEVNWKNRIKLQASAQKHTCHGISSTINLPNNVTKEDVDKIYRMAFDSGCKGITVYRDGCRDGVLLSGKQNDKIVKTNAPKRPKELNAEIFSVSFKGKKLYVAIGFLGGDPYEVFVGPDDNGEVSFAKGKIFKQARSKYIFIHENSKEFFLSNGHSDDNADAIARLASASLRHGCSLQFLIHQLEKAKGDMQSFSKVVARILKKFIKDGEVVSGEECPDCKSKLIRENGCKKCPCGWSACN